MMERNNRDLLGLNDRNFLSEGRIVLCHGNVAADYVKTASLQKIGNMPFTASPIQDLYLTRGSTRILLKKRSEKCHMAATNRLCAVSEESVRFCRLAYLQEKIIDHSWTIQDGAMLLHQDADRLYRRRRAGERCSTNHKTSVPCT